MRITLVTAALGLVACSSLQVHTDYDPAAQFHNFRTYSWKVTAPLENQLMSQRIVAAVDQQLQSRGMQRVDSGGDVFATYHGSVNNRLDIQSFGYGYGGWYGGWGGASRTTTVNEIPVGTLVVDLVDTKKNQMVWRGTATDDLRASSSPQDAQRRIDDAVKAMFHKFPPQTTG